MAKGLTRMDRAYLRFRGAAKKSRILKLLFVFACRILRKDLNQKIRKELPKAVETFVPDDRKKDGKYIKKLEKDIIENGFLYSVSPSEYFLLGFETLNDREKLSFVGDYEKGWLCQRLGKLRSVKIWGDKFKIYQFFRPYYRREAISIKAPGDAEALFDFIKKHNGAILKEVDSSMGKGVTLVRNDPEEMKRCWDSISDSLQKGTAYIAEELIRQSAETAVFHPKSVNTVRVMTFRTRDEAAILGAVFRIGRGDSVVDNAGSGGMIAEINPETGLVIGDAITEAGEKFASHPDSGTRIDGAALPKWEELLELSKTLASMLPDQKYVGWDLALTDQGWVMVEANSRAQFINQYPNRIGMRERVRKYFYPELGLTKDY